MPRKTKKTGYFVSANGNAKSDAVAVLVRAARRARLDYDGFLYVCQQARRKLKLARPYQFRLHCATSVDLFPLWHTRIACFWIADAKRVPRRLIR